MVKAKEFTVGKSVLVSLGQSTYENVRIETSLTVSLDEGDNMESERIRAMENVNAYVRDEVDAVELKQRREASKAKRFGV